MSAGPARPLSATREVTSPPGSGTTRSARATLFEQARGRVAGRARGAALPRRRRMGWRRPSPQGRVGRRRPDASRRSRVDPCTRRAAPGNGVLARAGPSGGSHVEGATNGHDLEVGSEVSRRRSASSRTTPRVPSRQGDPGRVRSAREHGVTSRGVPPSQAGRKAAGWRQRPLRHPRPGPFSLPRAAPAAWPGPTPRPSPAAPTSGTPSPPGSRARPRQRPPTTRAAGSDRSPRPTRPAPRGGRRNCERRSRFETRTPRASCGDPRRDADRDPTAQTERVRRRRDRGVGRLPRWTPQELPQWPR